MLHQTVWKLDRNPSTELGERIRTWNWRSHPFVVSAVEPRT